MNKQIKLTVDDKNLETVLSILHNLKEGLIVNIESDSKRKATQYQPKTNTVIREENSGTNDSNGKYLSPSAFKQRLKK